MSSVDPPSVTTRASASPRARHRYRRGVGRRAACALRPAPARPTAAAPPRPAPPSAGSVPSPAAARSVLLSPSLASAASAGGSAAAGLSGEWAWHRATSRRLGAGNAVRRRRARPPSWICAQRAETACALGGVGAERRIPGQRLRSSGAAGELLPAHGSFLSACLMSLSDQRPWLLLAFAGC